MKIAISGAHSQGKTTLVKYLQVLNVLTDYKFKTSLTRGLQQSGYNINEDGDEVTQLAVMTKHYQYIKESGNILYDRCALDGYVYSKALLKDINILYIIKELFLDMIEQYDIIFYVVPELPLIDDGQRTTKKDFFDKVVQCFEMIIKSYDIPVIRLSGSVEERAEQVFKAIQDKEIEKDEYKFYEL